MMVSPVKGRKKKKKKKKATVLKDLLLPQIHADTCQVDVDSSVFALSTSNSFQASGVKYTDPGRQRGEDSHD